MPHDAFLKSIIANPDDDLPRLVYADFLDETGDADRGEFIRVQCQLVRTDEHDPQFRELEDREHALLATNERAWFTAPAGLREWVWRRGFIEDVTDGGIDTDEAVRLFAEQPISTLRAMYGPDAVDDAVLANISDGSLSLIRHYDFSDSPWLLSDIELRLAALGRPRFRSFDLGGVLFPFSTIRTVLQNHVGLPLDNIEFGGSARLQADSFSLLPLYDIMNRHVVAQLGLRWRDISSVKLDRLLSGCNCAPLRRLDISDNPIGPDAYRAFENASPGMRLQSLDVSGTALAGISLEPLLKTRSLESLTKLEINGSGSARKNMEVLADSAFWSRATHLRAHSGTIPASTLEPLCKSQGPPALRLLDLADNYLRTEGVQLLCDAPWVESLTWLALSGNYLEDASCQVLAQCGRFQNLRTLHLANNNDRGEGNFGNWITDEGVKELAECPELARIRILGLSNNLITHRSVYYLLNSPSWRLSGLGIGNCRLGTRAVEILAGSSRLARLNWLDLSANPLLGGAVLRPLAESQYLSPLCELDCGGIDIAPEVLAIFRDRLGVRFSY